MIGKKFSLKMAKLIEEATKEEVTEFQNDIDDIDDDDMDYKVNSQAYDISFVELAIINSYLHKSYKNKDKEFLVNAYGNVDNLGRLSFGGGFDITGNYWFSGVFPDENNEFIVQTKSYVDSRNELSIQLVISSKTGIPSEKFNLIEKRIKNISFNNSEYKGNCIKVKMYENRFKGIEIIDIEESSNELILTDIQRKFMNHFISRLKKGGNARVLLNGEPGTGKTETIREVSRSLVPQITFIIPEFSNNDDLTQILEACEIFENGVIIMDDIDLFLGSRDNGSYTRLLGNFLSFFDGVKKRKISLLASTNDKGLVDKAAERPGRFNFTIDYGFLTPEQIESVCKIHLDKQWQIQEVYDILSGTINGKKADITGAFIANLAENLREMCEDSPDWNVNDTLDLITESYRGFYSSQVEKNKQTLGFKNHN